MEQPRLGDLTEVHARRARVRDFSNFCQLLARHPGHPGDAAQEATARFGESSRVARVLKSAVSGGTTSDAAWAAPLAGYEEAASAWIAEHVSDLFGVLQPLRVSPHVSVVVDNTKRAGGFIGEGLPTPAFSADLERIRPLIPRRCEVLVPLSSDLVKTFNAATSATMSGIIGAPVGRASDAALLNPDRTGANDTPPSLTAGVAPLASTGAAADPQALLHVFTDAGFSVAQTVLAMTPQTALEFATVTSSDGVRLFPSMTATGGNICGVVAHVTPGAVRDDGTKILVAVNGARVVATDSDVLTIDASAWTSLQMSDSPVPGATAHVPMMGTNLIAMRAQRYFDFAAASAGACAWMPVDY